MTAVSKRKEKDIRILPENIDENFKNSIEKAKSLAPNDAQILMWYANSLRVGDPKRIQNYLKALNIERVVASFLQPIVLG